jgi:hypothetical protein
MNSDTSSTIQSNSIPSIGRISITLSFAEIIHVFHYSIELAREIKDKFKIVPYSYFFFDFITWDKSSLEEHEHYDIAFVGQETEKRRAVELELREKFPDKKILFLMIGHITLLRNYHPYL